MTSDWPGRIVRFERKGIIFFAMVISRWVDTLSCQILVGPQEVIGTRTEIELGPAEALPDGHVVVVSPVYSKFLRTRATERAAENGEQETGDRPRKIGRGRR